MYLGQSIFGGKIRRDRPTGTTPTAPISSVPTDSSHIRFIKQTFEPNTQITPPLIKIDNRPFITPEINKELPTTMVMASPTANVASDLPSPYSPSNFGYDPNRPAIIPDVKKPVISDTVNQAGIIDTEIGPLAMIGIGLALYLFFEKKI